MLSYPYLHFSFPTVSGLLKCMPFAQDKAHRGKRTNNLQVSFISYHFIILTMYNNIAHIMLYYFYLFNSLPSTMRLSLIHI